MVNDPAIFSGFKTKTIYLIRIMSEKRYIINIFVVDYYSHVGFCNCSMFYCAFLCVHSSFAIISMGKRAVYHNHKLQTNPWYREEEPHNNLETPGRQTKRSNQLFSPSRWVIYLPYNTICVPNINNLNLIHLSIYHMMLHLGVI